MLGKKGGHAWIELDDPTGADRETVCIDRANGNNACMTRSVYYLLLQIEHATRYTYSEALARWTERRSDGPWM